MKEFYHIVFSQKPDDLNCWFDTASSYEILEIQSFLEGMRSDLTAVKNGILLKYNNGLAEGSVNKIKVIKRIMYGRNSFELLKAKVLLYEKFYCKIN